jgi:hypothetical protein
MVPDYSSNGYRNTCNCGWTGCPEVCVAIKTRFDPPPGTFRIEPRQRKKAMTWAERRKHLEGLRP